MKIKELKSIAPYFSDVWHRVKTFEVRLLIGREEVIEDESPDAKFKPVSLLNN